MNTAAVVVVVVAAAAAAATESADMTHHFADVEAEIRHQPCEFFTPATRQVLISHLDAVSLRRKDLANFFARIANATPRKVGGSAPEDRVL